MTGIYKITSLSGKVYVGQSRNIEKRWKQHITNSKTKASTLLDKSLRKYGIENHIFEAIHDLPIDIEQEILDQYEQLYINCFIECKVSLLNCFVNITKRRARNEDEESYKPSVYFYLKTPNTVNYSYVLVIIPLKNRKRIIISTGLTTHFKNWDGETQWFKKENYFSERKQLIKCGKHYVNAVLQFFRELEGEISSLLLEDENIDPDNLKKYIEECKSGYLKYFQKYKEIDILSNFSDIQDYLDIVSDIFYIPYKKYLN